MCRMCIGLRVLGSSDPGILAQKGAALATNRGC